MSDGHDKRSHVHEHAHGHGHSHGGGERDSNNWNVDYDKWDEKAMVETDKLIKIVKEQDWFKTGLHLLDFGCATGLFLRKLAAESKNSGGIGKSRGLDVESEMLERFDQMTREEGLDDLLSSRLMSTIDGSDSGIAEDEKEAFDLVTSSFVLGHVFESNVDSVLDGITRNVRRKGYVIVSEFDGGVLSGESEKDESAHVSDGGHFHTVFTEASMKEHLNKRGFNVENAKVYKDALIMGTGDSEERVAYFRLVAQKM
eukprot:CFRG2831T1